MPGTETDKLGGSPAKPLHLCAVMMGKFKFVALLKKNFPLVTAWLAIFPLVTALLAILSLVTAPLTILPVLTAFFLSCFWPTLFFGTAAAYAPPAIATIKARIATIMAGEGFRLILVMYFPFQLRLSVAPPVTLVGRATTAAWTQIVSASGTDIRGEPLQVRPGVHPGEPSMGLSVGPNRAKLR
jgi:hypothetical protein